MPKPRTRARLDEVLQVLAARGISISLDELQAALTKTPSRQSSYPLNAIPEPPQNVEQISITVPVRVYETLRDMWSRSADATQIKIRFHRKRNNAQ